MLTSRVVLDLGMQWQPTLIVFSLILFSSVVLSITIDSSCDEHVRLDDDGLLERNK